MRYLTILVSALLLSGATNVFASPPIPNVPINGVLTSHSKFADYDFSQDRMIVTSTRIYVISSFETADHISAFSHEGKLVWNAPFYAKILSWQIQGDQIFVFSKDRSGYQTYVTCVDRYTGSMKWQRP
jgi:outer membrane protein assembly factor BamB